MARKEFKDEQLLTRLIGAGVLLAIAVIVLPFILDGSGSQHVYDDIEPLPEPPQRPMVESSYSSRQPPLKNPGAREGAEDSRLTERVMEPPQQPDAVPSTGSATGPLVAPLDSSRLPAPVLAAPLQTSSIPSGWNIQVASFVVESNAVNLLHDIRELDIPAFANAVEGRKGTVFRVFVGPLDNQIDALDVQNRVNRRYRVESIMVRRD